ncbi:DolP-mannose mannosyltransferase [Haloterrigena sp. SYSU A558-1]|uniref:DolP-mannose mannosyltransferase n=1 Tax=Haloterrigena gelatinilytica TaxID=2741724 RepID=A0ABX2LIG8_9EURY|nr:DolP-mannose mannosyltransferase [Haloterrigena gelatinilytica]NUC74340.1 DolP-mannose mannosyltransferase [Haloterrigena gelatinilytica]
MTVRSRLPSRSPWFAVLGPIVAVLFVVGFGRHLLVDWPTIATDPAFFQHTGWYVLEGGVPYVDVWDVNPPVPFGIAAALAALSGGNMLVLHGLGATLTTLVAAASVPLVGWIARRVTGDDAAAIAAGLTMLVVPELFLLSPEGVRAQFYALFFGVLALALALRDRPFLAGALAALSAGSWQSGAVFALLVVGMAYQRTGGKDALSAVAGGAVVTGAVVLAFAATGGLVPMVVQTVVAPLTAGSSYTLAERVYTILLVFGYGTVLLPVALYGWARAVVRDFRAQWWVPAGGVLLTVQVLFVDLDGSTDALLWLAFVALGVAVAVDRGFGRRPATTDRRDRDATRTNRTPWAAVAVVAVVGLLVLSGLVWHFGSPAPQSTLRTMQAEAETDEDLPISPGDADVPSMQTIYWEQAKPETCHYRLSWNEVRWIAITDDRLNRRQCDAWPSRIDRG